MYRPAPALVVKTVLSIAKKRSNGNAFLAAVSFATLYRLADRPLHASNNAPQPSTKHVAERDRLRDFNLVPDARHELGELALENRAGVGGEAQGALSRESRGVAPTHAMQRDGATCAITSGEESL